MENKSSCGTKQKTGHNVSSNTLFHFMSNISYLKMAIKEGLWPRYNKEIIGDGKAFAIPMLSFCDIPLSLVKNHINKYGGYGIGVNKSFVANNKITPAIYISNDSCLMNKLRYALKKYLSPSTKQRGMKIDEHLLYYVKKVSGKNIDTKANYKFYDEREWRYIPPLDDSIHLELVDKNCDIKYLDLLSEKTKDKKIKLSSKDISYIIVSMDSEIKDIIKILKKIIPTKDIERICSRIITVEQINNDF